MNSKYDVVVIGGGHNGLVNAAYLARAGKKFRARAAPRARWRGGDRGSFPGFKFSVCSYVVSLLRPEIIRELDLPRHGLEILPLDGTFTPMPNGDYLWRVNDHASTRREIARHFQTRRRSLRRIRQSHDRDGPLREADHEHDAPRSHDPRIRKPGRTWRSSAAFSKTLRRRQVQPGAVDDHERGRFLDQWFETDVLKATMSASGIIGTFLGVRSPGTAYVLLHHYMGEIDGAFRSWGLCARWHRRDLQRDWRRGARSRSRDSHGGADCKNHCKRTVAPRASCSRTATRSRRMLFHQASIRV